MSITHSFIRGNHLTITITADMVSESKVMARRIRGEELNEEITSFCGSERIPHHKTHTEGDYAWGDGVGVVVGDYLFSDSI